MESIDDKSLKTKTDSEYRDLNQYEDGVMQDSQTSDRERKVILYIAVSMDGFIADRTGGVDWIAGEDKNYTGDYGYGSFIKDIDTVIIGYKTYHQIVTDLSPEKWFYTGMTSYILTHKKLESSEEIIFVDCDAGSLILDLKKKPGKDIWICGGADIVQQLVSQNLIDEYHLTVMPLLLGGGVRLFDENREEILLKLIAVETANGAIDCVYRRRQ